METYYVAKDGNDNHPGTEERPWRTIQKAASTMDAGDKVYVKNGTYNEKVVPANSGEPDAYITYEAYPGHSPVIDAGGYNRGFSSTKDYIELNGFEVRNSTAHGVRIGGGAQYNRIINCVIHDNDETGINVSQQSLGTSHAHIEGCEIYNNGRSSTTNGHGIIFYYGGNHSTVYDCHIHDNGYCPGEWGSGVEICGTDYCTVEGNEIYGNCLHGVDICGPSNNNKVVKNTIHGNARCGVALDNGAYDNTVLQNCIYKNSTLPEYGGGIYVWAGEEKKKPYGNTIINNTIYANTPTSTTCGGIGFEDRGITGHVIKNNIIWDNEPYEFRVADGGNLDTEDHNCFGPNGIKYRGSDYDLAGYKTASGQGAHSIDAYPMFVNEYVDEFHLRPDSPCINAGTDVELDYNGEAPDMGRYEYESHYKVGVFTNDPNLQGLWLLNEPFGTRYDETGNDNDLTDNKTVGSSTESKKGKRSADFDSSNSENLGISDSDQTGLDITGDISFGCWIKRKRSGCTHRLISKYNTSNLRSYQIAAYHSDDSLRCYLSSNGSSYVEAYTPANVVPLGEWHHVVAVYNGTDIKIYIDGKLAENGVNNPKSYSDGIFNSTATFMIGMADYGAHYMDGLIDEAFVMDRALLAEEVEALYRDGFRKPSDQPIFATRGIHSKIFRGIKEYHKEGSMAYIGSRKIDDYLTFACNTHSPNSGAATDADSAPTYCIYEDEAETAILKGTMIKLDGANTAGFYNERIQLTAANGFREGKCYTIYIEAAVNGIAGTMHHTFQTEAEVGIVGAPWESMLEGVTLYLQLKQT